MNEITKTSIFIAVAIVLFLIAVLIQPRQQEVVQAEMVGKTLFEDFNDPLAIKGLHIVKYDATAGEPVDFQIAEIDNRWCIPSFQNYPADAPEQMAKVTSELMDKQVLSVAFSDSGSDANLNEVHAMYGVIDPQAANITDPDSAGVKVTLTGDSENMFVNLIVGKEVEGSPHQRYVRIPDQNHVYVIETSPTGLSTKFDDWIEKNLLEISSFDFKSLEVDDYDIDTHPLTGEMIPRVHGNMLFEYDSMASGAKWTLAHYTKADPETNRTQVATLAPGESPDEEKLDQIRSAFNDLKIINVQKKPDSLAKALRENAPVQDLLKEPVLLQTGFFPAQVNKTDGTTLLKLISSQGGLNIRMKDGVVYMLNFGDNAGTQSTTAVDATEGESIGLNRYLLIKAEFDPALLEQPVITLPLSEIPTEGEPEDIDKIKTEHESIERENQRQQDIFSEKVAEGQKKVDALNTKFADWFYIISEDVFKKIHLTDDDLIKRDALPQSESSLPKGQFIETMMPLLENTQNLPPVITEEAPDEIPQPPVQESSAEESTETTEETPLEPVAAE